MKDPSWERSFAIREQTIGEGQPPFIIAEMACAHNGDLDRAKSIVDAASNARADAIQLQLFQTDHQFPPSHDLYKLLSDLELGEHEWSDLFVYARRTSMAIFAFAYDPPSLRRALSFGIDAIKLSSADLSNPDMTRGAALSGLPVTLGTGATTLHEIRQSLRYLQESGGRKVALMHGAQNFPTALEDADLRRIQLLRNEFQLPVGYQDHTDAELEISKTIDLVAIGMGACLIEKHITLSRAEKGTDYQAALEPSEFEEFVKRIRLVSSALGSEREHPLRESDHQYRQFQKKSVVAISDIPKGDLITKDKLAYLRGFADQGISPMDVPQIFDKAAARNIKKYSPIRRDDVVE